ncbi:MAG: signal peptidase II [Candidatus Aminicenantes bacterium]|nr:signal peptidase II [Candidatus Aminicenantes bacterium]
MKRRSIYLVIIAGLLTLDQITKTSISKSINPYGVRPVIPDFFNLVHVRNKGAIFGFFSNTDSSLIFVLLTLFSLAALGLVSYYFIKTPLSEKLMNVSLAFILAGALGNQIDRIFKGYVIDFLDFSFWGWHFPSFNVADSCISTGAVLLIFIFFFKRGPECTPSL